MKVLILYFSGTGNTDYVAGYLAQRLQRKMAQESVELELRSIEYQRPAEVRGFDLLLVGFPVYAGDAPGFVASYLEQLPAGKGRGAFVFCTKGAFAAGAVRLSLQRLSARGYVPLGGGGVLMPGTDGLSMVAKDSWMARKALQKDFDHLRDADRLVDELGSHVTFLSGAGEAEQLRRRLGSSAGPTMSDRVWAALYRATENYARARLHADSSCRQCGLCARICPLACIEMSGAGPRFADGCALCIRCLHACPQEAIQIGRLTVGKLRWKGPKGDFNPLRMRRSLGESSVG
jgi:ferredoxin